MVGPMKAALIALSALALGACTLPTNVALQKIDSLRAAQNACLSSHVSQHDDGVSDPGRVGYSIAASCQADTDRLVQYAVPYATPSEREGFQRDAALRATGYVLRARGTAT
jgi:hypothetical protein